MYKLAGTALFAGDLDPLGKKFHLIIPFFSLGTTALDLSLGVKLPYHIGNYLKHLRINGILLTVKRVKALKTAFFKQIDKLKLRSGKLRFDVI